MVVTGVAGTADYTLKLAHNGPEQHPFQDEAVAFKEQLCKLKWCNCCAGARLRGVRNQSPYDFAPFADNANSPSWGFPIVLRGG